VIQLEDKHLLNYWNKFALQTANWGPYCW